MITIPYEVLAQSVEAAGLDRRNIRADYSGRGMYGERCLGITHDEPGHLLMWAIVLSESMADVGEDIDWFLDARSDSMGLSQITYFPSVTVSGAPEWTPEDDDD